MNELLVDDNGVSEFTDNDGTAQFVDDLGNYTFAPADVLGEACSEW
jgi:hypothetical protein